MKVLSVDDSSIMRKIIQSTIDRLGFEFLEAENGQHALDVLKEHYQDVGLILLDWNMPVKDGYQTLLEVKQDEHLQNIPIMMVTTESERSSIIKAIQAGAINYVIKPFSQEDLIMKIMAVPGMELAV